MNNFALYTWAVLGYNLLVILWGAFVRATGSGAGCGNHWPLCNGQVIPHEPALETLIELSHRITSGFALFAVVGLVIWAWRLYPRDNYPDSHRVKRAAAWSLFFIVTEALIGAGLVIFEYVATNVSIARAYWIAAHLINTFFLLAALTLTAWWASGGRPIHWRQPLPMRIALLLAFVGMFILGASGGITALGDTLTLTAGIDPATSPVLAQLIALRIYHPLLAFAVGGLLWLAVWAVRRYSQEALSPRTIQLGQTLLILYGVQLALGALNVQLKAPVWLQLVHLLFSDGIWILLVILAASALATSANVIEEEPDTESKEKPLIFG